MIEDSIVLTTTGYKGIADVVVGDKLVTFDNDTISEATVVQMEMVSNARLYKIIAICGTLLCDGDRRVTCDFIPVKDITPGEMTLKFYFNGQLSCAIIKECYPTDSYADVYKIKLDNNHVFAIGCILTHDNT